MRILHTSDWHLGANLDGHSRLEEQKMFIDELCEIIKTETIDTVLVAGDIYDTSNPSASAESLFFSAMIKISDGGRIPVVVIAGNHDSPERLAAPTPFAAELGIIIFTTPYTTIHNKEYNHFAVEGLAPGCTKITKNGEAAVIAAMPFASERRLSEIIFQSNDEKEMQKNFSEKIEAIFTETSKHFRDDTINIATGHFHIVGGESSTGSERDIQLGGSFAVSPNALPKNAQYIAMGHLHRPQQIRCSAGMAHYSGSPIQYSLSEISYPKCVFIAEILPSRPAVITKKYLHCYKPIELWETKTVAEAILKCSDESARSCWAYIKISEARTLYQNEIKEMRRLKPDIVSIDTSVSDNGDELLAEESYAEKSIMEEFCDFYNKERNTPPPNEILELFAEILNIDDENPEEE